MKPAGKKTPGGVKEMFSLDQKLKLLLPVTLLPLLIISIIASFSNSSSGAVQDELVTVPGVVGLSLEKAQGLLQEFGFEVGESREAYSDTVPAGMIISTTPAGGGELEKGSMVIVTASLGPEAAFEPPALGSTDNCGVVSSILGSMPRN